jgi:hypothetical protein
MTELKNLKVPFQTHEMLRKRAKALGMKQFVLADALLLVGLKLNDAAIQRAVAAAQLTQPTASTTPEPGQQQPKFPSSLDE